MGSGSGSCMATVATAPIVPSPSPCTALFHSFLTHSHSPDPAAAAARTMRAATGRTGTGTGDPLRVEWLEKRSAAHNDMQPERVMSTQLAPGMVQRNTAPLQQRQPSFLTSAKISRRLDDWRLHTQGE